MIVINVILKYYEWCMKTKECTVQFRNLYLENSQKNIVYMALKIGYNRLKLLKLLTFSLLL